MKLLRIDMHLLRVWSETVPPVYEHLGGRGLIAKLLLEEIPEIEGAAEPVTDVLSRILRLQ